MTFRISPMLTSLVLSLSVTAVAKEDRILARFNTPEVPSYWNLREVKGEMRPERSAIRLTYPKWQAGMNEWPAAILDYPNGDFTSKDWSEYGFLVFDVTYFGKSENIVMLRLDDSQGGVQQSKHQLRPNGERTRCVVRLAETKLDVKSIRHYDLFLDKPAEDFVIELGTIRLTDTPFDADYIKAETGKIAVQLRDALKQLEGAPDIPLRTQIRREIEGRLKELGGGVSQERVMALRDDRWITQFPLQIKRIQYYAKLGAKKFDFTAIPPTLKLRQDEILPQTYDDSLKQLHAARGEAESLQFLVVNGVDDLQAAFSATPFTDAAGHAIAPELSVVGYVPVSKPTPKPFGFGIEGMYPDVLKPNQPFDVKAYSNQSLWLSVWVPEDAAPGVYRSTVTLKVAGHADAVSEISLKVYPVTLPKLGRLKTCWVFQPANTDKWYKGDYDEFLRQNLKYRFCMDSLVSSDCLPWNKVFSVDAEGKVTAQWDEFDKRFEYWRSLGKNTFSMYSPRWFGYKPVEEQTNVVVERQKIQLAMAHLKEKGWSEDFYLYVFDEPHPSMAEFAKGIGKFFQDAIGHSAHLILTACHGNIPEYKGYVNIYCPHINLYDTKYMAERQAAGDHAWMYTCIGTVNSTYPDTWKLDSYGTGHRAVGWWLFKYNVEGYLYWGVNYWDKNPWADAMTFPNGNGDGSMFYPEPGRKGQPWPALRMEIVRDGFEDYELLTLLKAKYAGRTNAEVEKLLACEGIIEDTSHYNQAGDLDYIKKHQRILELLQ